jgi:hypothetical protein
VAEGRFFSCGHQRAHPLSGSQLLGTFAAGHIITPEDRPQPTDGRPDLENPSKPTRRLLA